MSPLTIYTSEGLPRVPTGPQGDQGEQGPQGPKGDQGVQGPVGPGLAPGGAVGDLLTKTGTSDHQTGWVARRRAWALTGDNSGDGTTTSNTTFSTGKAPVFTAPKDGWYSIRAGACLVVDQNGATAAFALMIGTTVARLNQVTANAGWFTPVTIAHVLQLTNGQKVAFGYRPLVQGRTVTLVNSGGIFPMLGIDEVDSPNTPTQYGGE